MLLELVGVQGHFTSIVAILDHVVLCVPLAPTFTSLRRFLKSTLSLASRIIFWAYAVIVFMSLIILVYKIIYALSTGQICYYYIPTFMCVYYGQMYKRIQDQFYHAYKGVCVRLTGRLDGVYSVVF